jgi:hypothetical protein
MVQERTAANPATRPGGVAAHLLPLLLAAAAAMAAFVWLDHVTPAFEVSDDSIRDQLFVRDCVELERCHLIGANASLLGLHQGAVWLDLLVAVRLLGGDTADARRLVLVLLAAGVSTVFLVTWHWLGAALALPTAVLFAIALTTDRVASQLTNASLAAFPSCLAVAALLCFALSARWRFLVAASFALGAAINVHVASLSLLPSFAMIALAARPRPWRTIAAASAVFAATCLLTSSATMRANTLALAAGGLLTPTLMALLPALLAAAAVGPRFRRLAPMARAAVAGLLLLAPFAVAAGCAFLWMNLHFSPYYLHPVFAPAAVLISAIFYAPFAALRGGWRVLRWLPTTATVAALALFCNYERHSAAFAAVENPAPWSLVEVEAIAARLPALGWSYEDLLYRLQGPACRDLVVRLALFEPPPRRPLHPEPQQMQVVKVARGAIGEDSTSGEVVPLGDSVALLREVDSWMRPYALRACRAAVESIDPPACANARPPVIATADRFLFSLRSYPEIHDVAAVPPPYLATYEIPLQPRVGESRDLMLTDVGNWQITRLEGIRAEGPLPARRVLLHSPDGRPGRLIVARTFATFGPGPSDLDIRYPPCFFEARPGDPLLDLVQIDP